MGLAIRIGVLVAGARGAVVRPQPDRQRGGVPDLGECPQQVLAAAAELVEALERGLGMVLQPVDHVVEEDVFGLEVVQHP